VGPDGINMEFKFQLLKLIIECLKGGKISSSRLGAKVISTFKKG
jgi:hypothetical protein